MTPEEIYKKAKIFNVGARVFILETVVEYLGRKTIRKPARVIERYPYHLVVETKNGVRESFSYWDALKELELMK